MFYWDIYLVCQLRLDILHVAFVLFGISVLDPDRSKCWRTGVPFSSSKSSIHRQRPIFLIDQRVLWSKRRRLQPENVLLKAVKATASIYEEHQKTWFSHIADTVQSYFAIKKIKKTNIFCKHFFWWWTPTKKWGYCQVCLAAVSQSWKALGDTMVLWPQKMTQKKLGDEHLKSFLYFLISEKKTWDV